MPSCGTIHRWDGETLHLVATHNTPPAFAAVSQEHSILSAPIRRLFSVSSQRPKRLLKSPIVRREQAYTERRRSGTRRSRRTWWCRGLLLGVPMLKENDLIGACHLIPSRSSSLHRQADRARARTSRLQAVIAIQNTRLLNELRQRTSDLSKSLEQQTATSEVLQVISRSPGDLQPVFRTMLENATRICEAKFGNIYRWDGNAFHLVATHNTPPAFAKARRRSPVRPRPDNLLSRLVATKTVIHCCRLRAAGYMSKAFQNTLQASN